MARSLVTLPDTLHGDWIAGFTSGDGGFFVTALKAADYKIGYRTNLRYEICQDERDLELMNLVVDFMGCGATYQSGTIVKYLVGDFKDLYNIIIPFFIKHPIHGVKHLN